jgi:subtilisin family serine protease
MKQRIVLALTVLMVGGLLIVPFAAQSQSKTAAAELAARHEQLRSMVAGARGEDGASGRLSQELIGARGLVHVIVELEAEPAARVYARGIDRGLSRAQADSNADLQAAQIDRAQTNFLQAARSLGTRVYQRYNRVYNGLSLTVDASRLSNLASLAGVKAIHPVRTVRRQLTSSVPLVGAPQVWESVPGATGAGVNIAVIDTGIDYYHVGFGGTGLAAYDADDPTVIEAGTFPTTKVITGTDLVGDAFDGSNPEAIAPDPDPVDPRYYECESVGHGTHVAGIAAGQGVTSAGAAYTGPYNSSLNFDNDFSVGPGVAPEAKLIAVRVFGCNGNTTNDILVGAIEYAVETGADVINYSIGYEFGDYFNEPDSVAVDNASAAGVVFVGSAGNASDTNYVTGGASTANTAISVASSWDQRSLLDAFNVNSPASIDGLKKADFSSAYDWRNKPDVTGDLVYVPGPGTSTACNVSGASPYAAGSLTGRVLLVDWAPEGTSDFPCGSAVRANNAAAAGAVGIIMASGQLIFDSSIFGNAAIPAVFTTFDVGAELKGALATETVSITFSGSYLNGFTLNEPNLEDTLSDFSSRGPRVGDSALKPDLAAPGQSIFSVGSGTGNEGNTLGGTSQAAPHVAGAIALLRQLHPDWTPQELKAAVINSATNDLFTQASRGQPIYSPGRVGTGRLDIPNAAALTTLAYNAERPELVSVSFGAVEVITDTVVTKAITVENKGAAAANYSLAFAPGSSIPGVTYSFAPGNISVPAGGTTTVSVTMEADYEQMRNTVDPSLIGEQGELPRHSLSQASGNLALYSAAPTEFVAFLSGANEVPPNASTKGGVVTFIYDAASNSLDYGIRFTEAITIAGPSSHLHRGPAGRNGPIAVNLLGNGAYDATTPYSGTVTLTDADEALLYSGGLYANFHTESFPGGEIRGQVAPSSEPAARVAIHAIARPVSAMTASPDVLGFGKAVTATTTLELSGIGLDTGANLPTDLLSVVTAFELQRTSSNNHSGFASQGDIAAVGVNSDILEAGAVISSTLFFGVAGSSDWNTPNVVGFDIYIDVDGSGVDEEGEGAEFVLYNTNVGSASGLDPTDVFVTVLEDLTAEEASLDSFVNLLPASVIDTAVFNNNVMVLPVTAEALGLTPTASRINYRVFSFSYYTGYVEDSGVLSYDLTKPGLTFGESDELLTGPAYADLDGGSIPVSYNKANFDANGSKGVLLLHHHNASGNRVQAIPVNPKLYIPMAAR